MRLGLALRAFWKCCVDRPSAERIAMALDSSTAEPEKLDVAPEKPVAVVKAPTPPSQNAAVTLLATLQREARLVDLVYENLDQYADAQVGAAARPCLKQCRQTLDRLLHITRLLPAAEQETIELTPPISTGRFRWIGEAPANPSHAKVVHPGWQAGAIELPQWSGDAADQSVIAATQIEAIR